MAHRVMQLISSEGFYGAERVVVELGCHLHEHGWQPLIVAFDHGNEGGLEIVRRARERGLETATVPCRRWADLATLRRLGELARERGIAIGHSHGYKSDVYLRMLGRRTPLRRVATCHNWLSYSLKLKAFEQIDKRALRGFDHVAVVSPSLREQALRAGIAPERCTLIENGLNEPARPDEAAVRAMRESLGVSSSDEKLILFVGRLTSEKGVDVLLAALPAVTRALNARLAVVGEGELIEPLRAQAAQLGLADRAAFLGYRRDTSRLMAAADLFVIASHDEGLPMVLIEAMAARLPVVSTAVGMIPDVIRHGESGWLVPPGDPAALAEGMLAVLRAPERARAMAAQAHAKFERDHSRQAMGRRYEEIYNRVLQEAAR